jgi:hypothetical protein
MLTTCKLPLEASQSGRIPALTGVSAQRLTDLPTEAFLSSIPLAAEVAQA